MKTIILKPKFIFWLTKYFVILLFTVGIIYVSRYIGDYDYVEEAITVLVAIIIVILLYSYIDMLFCTKWIITEYNIQIIRGIFFRKKDYIELYRVVDYKETQNIIEQIFRLKTVHIISGDRTTPVLQIFGIDCNLALIEEIRERVEIQKTKRGIYEITNR
jgi:uncharacterized membrane protein YdbT with pleckstrin-like domain